MTNRAVLTVSPHPHGGWVVRDDAAPDRIVPTKDLAIVLAHETAERHERSCIVVYGWSGSVEGAAIHDRCRDDEAEAV